MKHFLLLPKDQPYFNWVFFDSPVKGPLTLRRRYHRFRCADCGKFDEERALESGLDHDLKIQSDDDYFLTDDGLLCISKRMRDLIVSERFGGVQIVEIPGNALFSIIVPGLFAETDPTKAKMHFENPKCGSCDRFTEVLVLPHTGAMEIPKSTDSFFAPSIWLENFRNRVTWLYASEQLVQVIKSHNIRGLFCKQY